jgi:hypothetical protein
MGAVALVAVTACAPAKEVVRRVPDGPGADDVYSSRFARDYGRSPTYVERAAWRDALDTRIDQYLRAHPDLDTSPRAALLRYERRVAPGMTGDEVTLLLGRPDARTTDAAAMREAAGRFWLRMAPRAKEMWIYPGGWRVYFDGGRVTDATVRAPLE